MPPFPLKIARLLRQQPSTWKSVGPQAIPPNVLVDEEIVPGYDRRTFFHPNPGDVLDRRYTLTAKIGWGSSSTVWLAQKKNRLAVVRNLEPLITDRVYAAFFFGRKSISPSRSIRITAVRASRDENWPCLDTSCLPTRSIGVTVWS